MSNGAESRLHDHVAWCGDGPGAFARVATEAFAGAAARGEKMILVTERPDPADLGELDDVDRLLRRGALELATVDATYANVADPAAQRALVESLITQSVDQGYTGLCIVADNSRMAETADEEFAAWLAWEATAERLATVMPAHGICFFDRRVVAPDRLLDLAAIHPLICDTFEPPPFQLCADGDVLWIAGEVDALCADQLRRLLSSALAGGEPLVDLSEVEFMDHRSLLTLNQVARTYHHCRVRAAKPFIHRVWRLLDVADPALEFC